MSLIPTSEFSSVIVSDDHYSVLYQQGAPGFDVENLSLTDISLKQLNHIFPRAAASGQHYSIKHSHHLGTINLDLAECKSLEKMVLWDIEFYRAMLTKLPLSHSFAIKVLSVHIAEDQMLLKDINKRMEEIKLLHPHD